MEDFEEVATQRFDYPFPVVVGVDEVKLQKQVLRKSSGIVFPTSLLIDGTRGVVAIYEGGLSVEQFLDDISLLQMTDSERFKASLPFAGKWYPSDAVMPET